MPTERPSEWRPLVAGMHHVALSVADLDRSAPWYEDLFGVERVMTQDSPQRRAHVYRFPGGRLTFGLVQHGQARTSSFDPSVVGLDTAAFSVATRADLEAWAVHFDRHGVNHSGVQDTPFGAMVNFVDPDGIQLALFWER